ncbi:MAG TPA: hypothetical protein VJO12_02615 [Stellaceae bacterium]|nr:hypothetical protein [Stellaceae bacterium]
MFDFDVVTGPANPTSLAKPAVPPPAKPLTPPPGAAMPDNSREAERSVADPAGSRP